MNPRKNLLLLSFSAIIILAAAACSTTKEAQVEQAPYSAPQQSQQTQQQGFEHKVAQPAPQVELAESEKIPVAIVQLGKVSYTHIITPDIDVVITDVNYGRLKFLYDGLHPKFTNELMNSGAFIVYEREKIEALFREADLFGSWEFLPGPVYLLDAWFELNQGGGQKSSRELLRSIGSTDSNPYYFSGDQYTLYVRMFESQTSKVVYFVKVSGNDQDEMISRSVAALKGQVLSK